MRKAHAELLDWVHVSFVVRSGSPWPLTTLNAPATRPALMMKTMPTFDLRHTLGHLTSTPISINELHVRSKALPSRDCVTSKSSPRM